MSAALQDPAKLFDGEAGGYVSSQIIYDVFKGRGNVTAVPIVVGLECRSYDC